MPTRPGFLSLSAKWTATISIFCATAHADPSVAPVVREEPPVGLKEKPMRYLENARIKLGLNLGAGGAVTYLEDKHHGGGNQINSHDWGRQIQLSYYSGPIPFVGPNGEQPHPAWKNLGWNPIQAGSVGKIPSKTTLFEQGPDFLRVRCIPMQWPLDNVPGDCEFEVTHRFIKDNVILMEARLINARLDKDPHLPAKAQEMPALYTNGPWFRLVTYLGDQPFSGSPPTTIVGKGDGRGWPWARFLATEQWTALVNEKNTGVGIYQPETARFLGGFAGPDATKGTGGPLDSQTGYIAPVAKRILDHNIDWTYRAHIIVGSLEEIRSHATQQPRHPKSWDFASDRHGWHHEHATDGGWPIRGGLDLRFASNPRGILSSEEFFWRAEDSPMLEIDADFEPVDGTGIRRAEVVIQPYGPEDGTDFPLWIEDPSREATEAKRRQFPAANPLVVPFVITAGRQLHHIPLKDVDGYQGGMTQLRLRLPESDGRVRIFRIALKP